MHYHRDFAYNTEVYAKGTIGYQPDDLRERSSIIFRLCNWHESMFPFAVSVRSIIQ